MNGIYISQAQRNFLDDRRAQLVREQRIYEQQSTPEAAVNVARFSTNHPLGSSEAALTLVASGVPADAPEVQALVNLEVNTTETNGPIKNAGGGVWNALARGLDEFVYDPTKGVMRWGMMGLMSVYETTLGGAPIRAAQQSAQNRGMGYDEAWQEQQPFVTKAFADTFLHDPMATLQSAWKESTTQDVQQEEMLRSGALAYTSNQGGGFFVNSDVAPDVQDRVQVETANLTRELDGLNLTPNERYKRELQASPEVWRRAVEGDALQAGLGGPMTQQGYANRESIGFTVPSFGGSAGQGHVWTPWSPGRIAAATVFEPGTGAFSVASGIGDITSQLVLDPMNFVGGYWAKTGLKGRTLWAGVKELAKNVRKGATLIDLPNTGRGIDYATGAAHQGARGWGFHGGEAVEGALTEGGVTSSLSRAVDYAKRTGDDARVAVMRESDMPTPMRASLEAGTDVEQFAQTALPDRLKSLRFRNVTRKMRAKKAKLNKANKKYTDAVAKAGEGATDAQLDEIGKLQMQVDEAARKYYDDLRGNFDSPVEMNEYDEYMGAVSGRMAPGATTMRTFEAPRIHHSMSIKEAEAALAAGRLPYIPDQTVTMMKRMKLWLEGAAYNVDNWRNPAAMLTPFDPPEEIAIAIRQGNTPSFIKNEKKWLNDYDDVFLDKGAVDELATSADKTNRQGNAPIMHRVHTQKSYGTNHKVRVYGGTLDLTGTSIKGGSKKLREAVENSGIWGKYGLEGDELPEEIVRLLREEGIGKIRMPEGRMSVVDDFIGGSKSDELASRTFFSDGNARMHGTKATPNAVNKLVDQVAELSQHGINPDGTIDGTKLSVKEMKKLVKENQDLVNRMEDAVTDSGIKSPAVPGNRPGIDQEMGFTLNGKQADTLVNDLFESAAGENGAYYVDRFFNRMEKRGVPVPSDLRQSILEAARNGDKEGIRGLLTGWVGRGASKVELPGGTQYGRLRTPTAIIDDILGTSLVQNSLRGQGPIGKLKERPWFMRQLAMMMPGEAPNLVEDPSKGYSIMVSRLDNYGFNRLDPNTPTVTKTVRVESRPDFAARGVRTGRRGKKGTVKIKGELPVKKTTISEEHTMERVLERARRLEPGNRAEAYAIMEDYQHILFEHLKATTKGRIGDEFIEEAVRFIRTTGDMHITDAERIGQTARAEANGGILRSDGEIVYIGGMNTTGEMWDGMMHIPDATLVKRVAGYQTRYGEIANMLVSKQVIRNGDADMLKLPRTGATAKEKERWLRRHERMEKTILKKQLEADGALTVEQRINQIMTDSSRVEIRDRAWYFASRSMMNKLWKPLVLLRGAWTIRIMMDDQLRVAASGQSMFNHPMRTLTYALQLPRDFKNAFRTGFIDINGIRVSIDNIDAVQHGLMYQQAAMAIPDMATGKGGFGSNWSTIIARNDSGYGEGLTARLSQFGSDGLGRRLARNKGPNRYEEAKAWLKGAKPDDTERGVTGARQMENIKQMKADHPELKKAFDEGDEEVLDFFIRDFDAQLHRDTGGIVAMDSGDGRWLEYGNSNVDITDELRAMGYTAPDPNDAIKAPRATVIAEGDDELLDIIATGQGSLKAPLLKRGTSTLGDAGHAEFGRLVSKKLSAEGTSWKAAGKADRATVRRFPSQVHGPDQAEMMSKMTLEEALNNGVGFFYEWMMTKPSDYLSRSPLFSARYWRSMGERLPFADDGVRESILARARKAGVEQRVLDAEKDLHKMMGPELRKAKGTLAVGPDDTLDSIIDNLDEHAKAAGLAEVESTLFNLTQKRNISDSLNLIFPFVEAWGEFITRWSRLMVYGDRNIKNMNRFQQGINGVRESDPFSPTGDQGFFHDNEFGQEVFSYPAFQTKAQIGLHNLVAKVTPLTEISPEVADAIQATGSVEAMNFASGFIPGFGPVFQLGSKAALSEDPRWDGIKQIIAPFGTSGGMAGQFAPAWLKRVLSALGSSDTQLNAMYLSTVQDVVRTKLSAGHFDGKYTMSDINAVVEEAENEARNLLLVRAANTWWAPTSPSYQFTQADESGKVYTYHQIGKQYRDILYDEAGGDQTVAFDIFYNRYGSLPTSFTQSKTYTIKAGPVTTEGFLFERENPGVFDAYPNTALYLMPGVHSETNEFNYGRYLERLRTSQSEQWTGEQLVALNDNMLGDMEYDHGIKALQYLLESGHDEDRAQHGIDVMKLEEDIHNRHPYWRQQITGKRIGATAIQKQAEVKSMLNDPNLRGVHIVEAAREYNRHRDDVIQTLKDEFGLGGRGVSVSSSQTQAGIEARAWLRQKAAEIGQRVPEFETMWNTVYSREVNQEHDGWANEVVSWYSDDVDFFDLVAGISSDTLPVYSNEQLGVRA